MARKNEKIKVEIDGDSTGLSKALQQAEQRVDAFGKKAGGSLGGFASNTSQVFGKLSTGIGGIAAVALGAGTAVGALVLKVNGLVRELNQLSTRSGISVTDLQKLQKAFRQTGIDAEGLADISQDTSDKMGEGYAAGTGEFITVVKEMGLNVNDFTKYVGKANGGIEAMVDLYYKMRDAGKTQAEITYAMEAVASNGSRLTGVLSEFNSYSEAMANIQKQTVAVSEDQAKAYEDFDNNLRTLQDTGQQYLIETLNPIVSATNEFIAAMKEGDAAKGFWDTQINRAASFSKLLKSMGLGFGLGDDALALIDQANAEKNKNNMPVLNGNLPTGKATVSNPRGNAAWTPLEDPKKAAEKAAKAAAAAAKAAASEQAKAAQQRIAAQAALDKVLVDQTEGTNERQLAEFKRQQNEIVNVIKKSAKTLGLSDVKLQELLNDQLTAGAAGRLNMINQMIGYSNPNQQTLDQNALLANGDLNKQQSNYLGNQLDQSLGLDTTSYDLERMNEERDAILRQNELLIQDKESFEKRKAAITAQYATKALQIQNQEYMNILSTSESAMSQIGDGMAAAFGQSSGAAQAFYSVQKGITISMTIMKIQEALASALSLGFPQNLAAYAQIAGMGMSIISTAKGASNSGQFHGGVDNLPASYNDKSFVLKAGERVVQPEANKKLTQFLDNQDSNGNGTGGGDIIVNAPMYNYGQQDDKAFQEKLKKHQNSIVQAVRDSQRRNS